MNLAILGKRPAAKGGLCENPVSRAILVFNPKRAFYNIPVSQFTMASSESSSNFQAAFNAALETYEKATKNKLLTHPLSAQLESCNSPDAILSVLKNLLQQSDRDDERLRNWLDPTVKVLYTFSATLGGGAGLVTLKSLSDQNLSSDCSFSGISRSECDLYRHRRPSFGESHPDLIVLAIDTGIS